MAILLFGLAGLLALISFTVLPAAPSPVDGHGRPGDGHVVTTRDPSENPAENANRGLEEARARHAAAPVDFGAAPGDPAAVSPVDTAAGDMPANQGQVPQQTRAAPGQPAAPPAPKVQAAPQVTFVPGQPMVDTNPSR